MWKVFCGSLHNAKGNFMKTIWDNVDLFEELVAEYAGSKYGVAVDSCTNALFLSMMYLQSPPRSMKISAFADQDTFVDVPRKTYVSVPMMVANCGFKINFTKKYWGGTYQLNPLNIVDGAQRFRRGMYEKGNLHCLSFHAKKILSIGRGGMILTDSKKARDWLRAARYDGRESIYYNDLSESPPPMLGWHMYMTPEEAVRGIEQFYKLPDRNKDSGKSSDYNVDLSIMPVFEPYLK